MKVGIYHEFGEAEVIKYEDAEMPSVGAEDVLIRVKACAMNSLDTRLRSGKSPRPVSLPHVGGMDIAGEVKETGKSVWGVFPGDRVVVNSAIKTDSGLSIIGASRHGGFAEFVSVPAKNVCKIPDSLSFDAACTLPICYLTAVYGFTSRGGLKEGETVVVHAAGSGTGTAAIQVAKHLGAKVIATAGSDEKLEKARALGVDQIINYRTQDFAEEIKGGVDMVFDPVGADYWERNLKILKPGGRLLLVGVVGGGVVDKIAIGPVIQRDLSVIGVTVFNASTDMLRDTVELAAGETVSPVISRKFPLSDLAGAHKALEHGRQFGKVVVNP